MSWTGRGFHGASKEIDLEIFFDPFKLDRLAEGGGGGWWLVFCNNLRLYLYSAPTSSEHLFQSVPQSLQPTIHQSIHFFIHPSILACQPVHPSTWPSAKEVPGMLMTSQWRNRESTSTKSTVYNLIDDVVIIMNWLRRMLMIFSGEPSCHH